MVFVKTGKNVVIIVPFIQFKFYTTANDVTLGFVSVVRFGLFDITLPNLNKRSEIFFT